MRCTQTRCQLLELCVVYRTSESARIYLPLFKIQYLFTKLPRVLGKILIGYALLVLFSFSNAQGVCLVVFGPTLLDISEKLHVGVGILTLMFLVRAVGGVIGVVVSGLLMDWLPHFSYTLLCFIIVGEMASMFLLNSGLNSGKYVVNMYIFVPTFSVLSFL